LIGRDNRKIGNCPREEGRKTLLNRNFAGYGYDPALKEEIIFKTGALYEPF